MTITMNDPLLLRAVDRPDFSGEVLFDFNDELGWPSGDNFTITPPTLIGNVGGVGAEFDYAGLAWQQVIRCDDMNAMRLQSKLARVMQRPEFYLMIQYSAASPRFWFRCLRSSPGGTSLTSVYRGREKNDWIVNVSLVVEPYMLGERRTASVTVGNDPATGGLSVVLPDPGGDGAAPFEVDMSAGASSYVQPFVSVLPFDFPGGVVWPGVFVSQMETWTRANSTTAVDNAAYSGGRYLLSTVYSEQPSLVRATGVVAPVFAGRYRLFLRCALTQNVGGTGGVVWVNAVGEGLAAEPQHTITYGGSQLVDLGVLTVPHGNPPSKRPYTIGGSTVSVYASCSTGIFQLSMDYVVAIPVDLPLDQASHGWVAEFRNGTQTDGSVVLRLNDEGGVEELSGGAHLVSTPETPVGRLPLRAVPGATNVMHVLTRRRFSASSHDDLITTSATLNLAWHPRHLVGYFADA